MHPIFLTMLQEHFYKNHSCCQKNIIRRPFLISVNTFLAYYVYIEKFQATELSLGMSALTCVYSSKHILLEVIHYHKTVLNQIQSLGTDYIFTNVTQ